MKPALTMDGKAAAVDIPTVQQAEPTKATSKRNHIIGVSFIFLVSLLVVVGLTLGAFYAGLNAGQVSCREAWATFNTGDDGRSANKERVDVTENDADFIKPEPINMVIDHEQEMLILQYDRTPQGDAKHVCYVYYFEPGMFESVQTQEKDIIGEHTSKNMTVHLGMDAYRFESTGEVVPISELPPSARQMCSGASIHRATRTEKSDIQRVRRAATTDMCCESCFCTGCTIGRCSPYI